jgi:hypothetical protein
MANIETIERRIADAQRSAAQAQRLLDEHLIETEGVHDAEAQQLSAEIDQWKRREQDLRRALLALEERQDAAAVRQGQAEIQSTLDRVRKFERRYVSAAAAIDAALVVLREARSEFEQAQQVLQEDALFIIQRSDFRDLDKMTRLQNIASHGVLEMSLRLGGGHLAGWGRVAADDELASMARHHISRSIESLELCVEQRQSDEPAAPIRHDESSAAAQGAHGG